jgi:hypothetical protein
VPDNQAAINSKIAVARPGRPGWSMRQFSIAAFSSRGKVTVVRVLYAWTAAGARVGSALATGGYLGTHFLADGPSARESLLVGLCFIKYFINTKPNFALIVDRDVVMHHKI